MIRILLFASLREQTGKDSLEMELPDGGRVADVYTRLTRSFPDLPRDRNLVLAAVNEEHSEWDARVKNGDEVAFFPPVSGGSLP